MTPGIYPGIPNEAYHAGPGLSNSGLRNLAKSPWHYYKLHLDPKRPAPTEKAGQLDGNLAHCAILEPAQFDERYIVGPDVNKNTTVWKDFVRSLPKGATAISQAQKDVAFAQAASVRALPDVAALLQAGMAEVSAYWTDPITGELCRCRPDFVSEVNDDAVILLDVKTYSDASPREFRRQVAAKGYHGQDAWYTDGYSLASGKNVVGFVFVAVEMAYPYASCAMMVDDEGREKGRANNRALVDLYHQCMTTGVWPSYSESVELISLPAWAL